MEQRILHRSDSRGLADFGWLLSRHTFSFGSYHDPERMGFGALRVLNDDVVAGGMGFGEHPHRDMEIVSIPLSGDLEHQDSMGNRTVIRKGDIQVMSAGTGVRHSEYNHHSETPVEFLQIWVYPDRRNVTPRYDQKRLDLESLRNEWVQVLSPYPDDDGVWIHQQAWFHMGVFDENREVPYKTRIKGNGVYAFVIEGEFSVEGTVLHRRDGLGLTDKDALQVRSHTQNARMLLMEIPMEPLIRH
jgi:redox-sensitive bicupin YhaK (pirin superfamily)